MRAPLQDLTGTGSPANPTPFSASLATDKVTSYMWYVHVLVRVNTEDRLRAKLHLFLEKHHQGGAAAAADDDDDDLTDHLVLRVFGDRILARLVASPPMLEQASGYTRVLSDIPLPFRQEFCRRLYCLVFRKHIVEWPHGICVPEAVAAADVQHILHSGLRLPDGGEIDSESARLALEHKKNVGVNGILEKVTQRSDEDDEEKEGKVREGEEDDEEENEMNDDDDEAMSRGGYFGTVANPLPEMSWPQGRDSCSSTPRGGGGGGGGEEEQEYLSREQPIHPQSLRWQLRGATPEDFQDDDGTTTNLPSGGEADNGRGPLGIVVGEIPWGTRVRNQAQHETM
ncbi:hypothetical protein M406DRAFT_325643 [Cryphonectria parasitica EP155]|uniref:Uncharacterized protein n=1 Tax=Cryphonectria parasitica (strain ATCC 38755 / EP155) TaxID=660469 RepID=A0A9P4YBU3_CRYP1|nr:uncharacterized protein M406DRAFT_325643 [Cryphonectria parasitica EP155]KAF3770186.1 hypothetical protein M406DRAFT_325643 [Cryphonectria parasitica EP155]